MIRVNGNEYRTLSQPIYLGDGRQVCRVYANDRQVYPEMGNANIIKIRGRRTIHNSHSHDGLLADALYGVGAANRNTFNKLAKQIYGENPYDVYDNHFKCGPIPFDITVSFSAVIRSSYPGMLAARTNGNFKTTDFRYYDMHLNAVDMRFGSTWVGRVIQHYNETGSWDTPGTSYNYSPIMYQDYQRFCCPLCDMEPITCRNYIETLKMNGSFESNNFIDADILVSIEMSTPLACSPMPIGEIWRSAFIGYTAVWGKCYPDQLSFPEFSENNGIHRVHAVLNDNPDKVSNGYPHGRQTFRKVNGIHRPLYSSEPLIGNGKVTCGFPSYTSGTSGIIDYLCISGFATDTNLTCKFPDWGAEYNFTENLQSKHTGIFYGVILCEVPIDEFLYVGSYANAPAHHREPQLSEL